MGSTGSGWASPSSSTSPSGAAGRMATAVACRARPKRPDPIPADPSMNGVPMNDEVMDELGPIDYVVIEFPAGKADFSGAMAEKLKELVEAGIVRVLDLLIITKDDDGEVDAFELHEFENGDAG